MTNDPTVSVVLDATSTACAQFTVSKIVEAIRDGSYAEEITAIRDAFSKGGKKAADPLKKKLPGILWSGTFYKRANDSIEDASGLICADLDNLNGTLQSVRESIAKDPHVFAAFQSPTGTGLKVVFKCDPKRPHIESFKATDEFLKSRYGLDVDQACKDVARLCFFSWDPAAVLNPDASSLPYSSSAKAAPVISAPSPNISSLPTADDVRELLKYIKTHPPYGDWIRICSAVWSVLSMEEGCRVLIDWSPPDQVGEYEAKFNKRLTKIGFGTLVHYAQQGGYSYSPAMKAKVLAKEIADNGGVDPWGECISAFNLCSDPPATPPELIRGVLYEGGTLMLSGASKSHKTYTMLAAGIALAGGHEWLGFKTVPVPVLYINLELQDFATAHRLQAIANKMGVSMPHQLFIFNLRGVLVTIDSLEARIQAEIQRTGARLVVLDPHYKIAAASDVEEVSNDSQAVFLYRLENAICSQGAAVMVAHHFAKGDSSMKKSIDRAAGAGALARWPDVVMTLTDNEEPDCATVEFSLRNFAPVAPFVVRWNHPIWQIDGSVDPSKLRQSGAPDKHPASELLSFLTNGMSNKEWRSAANWPESTYRRKRDQLLHERAVRETSGCFYRVTPQSP